MKTRNAIVAALAASSVLLMSACDVDQTQEGEMPDVDVEYREGELPEYEIRQTEEGRMPDVDEPDMGMRGEDMPAEVDPPNPD